MQNGRIRSAQLSASSVWNRYHGASNARLHMRRRGARTGAWSARHNNRNQWLRVDFGRPTRVTKIATQGRQDARQWVRRYYLSHGVDGVHFAEFKKNSQRRVGASNSFDSFRNHCLRECEWKIGAEGQSGFPRKRDVLPSNNECLYACVFPTFNSEYPNVEREGSLLFGI